MNCDDLLRRLTEDRDDNLSRDVCDEIERHLRECPSCEGLRGELEQLSSLCRCCASPRLPDDVRERITRLLQPS